MNVIASIDSGNIGNNPSSCQIINEEICGKSEAHFISEIIRRNLRPSDDRVYASLIDAVLNKERNYCIRTMMTYCNLSESAVKKSIRNLVKYNIISRIQRGHRAAITIINRLRHIDLSFCSEIDKKRIEKHICRIDASLTQRAVEFVTPYNIYKENSNNKNVTRCENASPSVSSLPHSKDSKSLDSHMERTGLDENPNNRCVSFSSSKEMKSDFNEFREKISQEGAYLNLSYKKIYELYQKIGGDIDEALKQIKYLKNDLDNGLKVIKDPWLILINAIQKYGGYSPNSKIVKIEEKRLEFEAKRGKQLQELEEEREAQNRLKIRFYGDSEKLGENPTEEQNKMQESISDIIRKIRLGEKI